MSKRPRVDDSDDDDELWSEAVMFEEAIIRTQTLSQQQPQPSQQQPLATNRFEFQHPAPPTTSTEAPIATVEELQRKIDSLLRELMKKAREKLDLINELNKLKANSANFCEKNCKRQVTALNTDIRFKDNELLTLRNRVKELSAGRKSLSPQKPGICPSSASHQVAKKLRSYPQLNYHAHPSLDVFEEFILMDPTDVFARKQFIRWCSQQGDTEVCPEYVEQLKMYLNCVVDKCISTRDPEVSAALINYLSSVQESGGDDLFNIINWKAMILGSDANMPLLTSLFRFLKTSPEVMILYPMIKIFILDEAHWRAPGFEKLLNAAIEAILHQPLNYEGESIAKEILRVYRQILDTDSDPVQMEMLLTGSLRILFQGADLEGEMVSVVTRAEAFHHLGEVLKKVIRWQPTVSHTGCPEMMEIAEMSFRDN